jgi:short-subunit dehydrogenase
MYKPKPLNDLNILLTGATGGVGEAIFKELSARGGRIFATSRTQTKLDTITEDASNSGFANIRTMAADLNSPAQIENLARAAVEWFEGRIDVLINNAGIGYHCPVSNIRVEEVVEVMTVNVIAPIMVTTHSLPALRRSTAPKIINISSILGSKPMPLTATYTASKHALNGFSKVLRLEEAASKLSVTLIEPGAIDTAFIERTHDPYAVKGFGGRKLEKLSANEVARWVVTVIESPPSSCPELIRIAPMGQAI